MILIILLLDQGTKIYIKLNYPLSGYGVPPIVDWGFFKLLFVENKGMAMGTKLNDFLPFISEDTANSTIIMPSVMRAYVTPNLFFIGFIPGLFSMLFGTALAGRGIYKRETARLFKELEV